MNARIGLLRLWLFASVIWLVAWAAYVWFTRLEEAEDPTERTFLAFHTGFGKGRTAISEFGFGDYLSLAAIEIGIPLAVFVLGYVVCWARQASEAKP
jgi:hypothetical protein